METRKHFASCRASVVLLAGVLLSAGNGILLGQGEADGAFKCTAGTLKGRFAVIGGGFVPSGPPPAPLVPAANISLMTLDGKGNLTDKITVSDNGQIAKRVLFGTYKINEDCTGELTIVSPVPPFQLVFDIVVADLQGTAHGKEFYAIGAIPGGVFTFTAKRIQ